MSDFHQILIFETISSDLFSKSSLCNLYSSLGITMVFSQRRENYKWENLVHPVLNEKHNIRLQFFFCFSLWGGGKWWMRLWRQVLFVQYKCFSCVRKNVYIWRIRTHRSLYITLWNTKYISVYKVIYTFLCIIYIYKRPGTFQLRLILLLA